MVAGHAVIYNVNYAEVFYTKGQRKQTVFNENLENLVSNILVWIENVNFLSLWQTKGRK